MKITMTIHLFGNNYVPKIPMFPWYPFLVVIVVLPNIHPRIVLTIYAIIVVKVDIIAIHVQPMCVIIVVRFSP